MKTMDELEQMFVETGELDEVRALAAKKVLTADIQLLMDNHMSKAQLASNS